VFCHLPVHLWTLLWHSAATSSRTCLLALWRTRLSGSHVWLSRRQTKQVKPTELRIRCHAKRIRSLGRLLLFVSSFNLIAFSWWNYGSKHKSLKGKPNRWSITGPVDNHHHHHHHEYLECLICTGPKRLHILYKYVIIVKSQCIQHAPHPTPQHTHTHVWIKTE